MGMMERTIPCKYHWQCVLGLVLMASRGHFPRIDVRKTLRGLQKKHCTQLLKMLISSGTSRPGLTFVVTRAPVFPHLSRFFFQNFTVTDCGMKFCAALVQIVDTLKPQILLSFLSKIHLALSGCRTRPNAYCCLTSSDILAIVLFFPNSSFISN